MSVIGLRSILDGKSVGSTVALDSRGCAGDIQVEVSSDSLIISATVSVTAEKAVGDLVHPIRRTVGMATSCGLPGRFGNGVASFNIGQVCFG